MIEAQPPAGMPAGVVGGTFLEDKPIHRSARGDLVSSDSLLKNLSPSRECRDRQSAFKFDPRSASNFDPLERRVRAVAVAPSELAGVAETAQSHQSRPESPEFADQRLRRASLIRGNIGGSHTPGIRIVETTVAGWGGRIRTSEWRNQNPLPYHLATPQCAAGLPAVACHRPGGT